MRFNSVTLALTAALAMSAAACGGDDDGDSLTPGGFVTALSGSICGKAFECMSTFPGTPADFSASFGASEAACPAALGFVTPATVQASFDAGHIMFTASLASQCIAGIDAFTCEQFWNATALPTQCDTALVGTVANGGACTFNGECVSGSCDGTMCTAPAVAGEPSSELPQDQMSSLLQ